jgi:ParB-like chromosome segregation protein Spo0J
VTENGVKRYMSDAGDELPMVYKYRGELFIADGHHRLVAAWLRGNKTAVVRVVEVPDRE